MTKSNDLFPSIGSAAEQTDHDEVNRLDASDVDDQQEDRPLQEIESMCMACQEQGVTRMLLTSIPYFKEIIVMSFECPHCGTKNNEIQAAGSIKEQGTVYTAKILTVEDLNRQIVKSASCTVVIQEWELTIPPSRGQLTTVEGLIRDIVNDLSADQPLRRIENEAAYLKIETILDALRSNIMDTDEAEGVETSTISRETTDKLAHPFTIRLDDPAGNSWIEFLVSMADPKWNMRQYNRTKNQNIALGLAAAEADVPAESVPIAAPGEIGKEEVLTFEGACPSCREPIETLMQKVNIPHFKDVFIMSTNCEKCGYRDNEVKSGAAISAQGKRITLKVEDAEDLSRDILKSETCGMEIPEIDFVLQGGTLGGRFTTLEGLLDQIYEELSEKVYMTGDSDGGVSSFTLFLAKLKQVKSAEIPFTLILDDPLANSYLQNIYAPDPDPNMTIVNYDRKFEQNEELGLNDIKVEGYENETPATTKGVDAA